MPAFIDLTGQRFGRLLVLHRDMTKTTKTGGVSYICLCDCGNTTSRPRNTLVTGNTKSCGCLKAEQQIHELGWNHPDVRNPRRKQLYAQKKAAGHVRIRNAAYYERSRARHQERMQENPEAVRETWRKAKKQYSISHPGSDTENTRRRRARIMGAAVNDFTNTQWEEMKAAYGYRCVYCPHDCWRCRQKKHTLTQDHITPLSKGGDNTASNIVPACLSCNSKKNDGDVLKPIQPLLLLVSKPITN
jgi:HNH endonuclease